MKNFSGKVVIVTGASSGIGKACAIAFANAGADVVLASRNIDELKNIAQQISSLGVKAISISTDVSKESDCKNLIDETIKNFGRIDILINCAGISMRALLLDVQLDVLRKVMEINFWGTVYSTKFALPYLLQSKGSVVGVSSIAGKTGLPGRTGYSSSKFAMEGFLQTVRIENLRKGLHVLVACPGFTASNIRNVALNASGEKQVESPRDENKMMQPEVVAEKILQAVIKRKRDLVLTSEGKLAVLLSKFFPSLLDKMVYNHMAKEKDSPFK
ncbi:MAG TPA: SDR family oxidoreductase [Bacteroidia bacterium]|nr:SDR family oxidoreductase [Bacteroidia bacterium]